MSVAFSPEVVARVLNPGKSGSSIRHDFKGVVDRMLKHIDRVATAAAPRDGHISEKEFGASFPIGVEALAHQGHHVDSVTIHVRKKRTGRPLATLVSQPGNLPVAEGSSFSLDDLKTNLSGVAKALTTGEAYPVRKMNHGKPGEIVAYVVPPKSSGPVGTA